MTTNNTALVLIEFQNEFCSPDGVLYNAVKDVMLSNKMLENTKELLNHVRGKCQVVYVPIIFDENYPELGCCPSGILKGVVDGQAFLRNHKGSQIYSDLAPQKADIVVEGKKTLCAFGSSNLDYILRANNIKKVIFGGFLTNVCVESTARTAFDRGYEVYILSDCCAATSMEEQKFTIEKNFPLFSKVITHKECIEMLTREKDLQLASKERSYYSN